MPQGPSNNVDHYRYTADFFHSLAIEKDNTMGRITAKSTNKYKSWIGGQAFFQLVYLKGYFPQQN